MSKKQLTPWQLLRNKFPANECVLIEEISDKSGFERSRSLDYMVINLWNSRGLAVTGIEQKSFRNDWLKELKDPKKQENHFKHCDFFYLLTTNENVAKIEEIPITWGWYHIKGNRIITMKQAPPLKPEPIGRSLMCAMLRRAADKTKYVHIDDLEDRIVIESEKRKEKIGYEIRNQLSEFEALKNRVKVFEEESGISIGGSHSWIGTTKKTAQAVKWLTAHGVDSFEKRLLQLQEGAKKIHDNIGTALEELIKEPIKIDEDD